MFTRIYDEQRKLFDDTILAIKETIHICRDKNILSSYIEKYEREALDTMLTLYDPEAELCEHIRCEVAQGEARGEARGMAKGEAIGEANGRREGEAKLCSSVAALMKKLNISKEKAMEMLDITGSDAEKISKLLEQQS